MKHTLAILLAGCATMLGCATTPSTAAPAAAPKSTLELGSFSISLTVKDLAASRSFYEKLGFTVTGGDAAQNWLVLRNGDHVVGLFHGMFDKNTLTFNPGWTQQATPLASFTDVRELQARLETSGLTLVQKADPASTGPAYLMLIDPDGNPVLIDQHVGKPK
jgi:catechol 2,3-dioxygenase-like lactoylglutathione lyase family enzyme